VAGPIEEAPLHRATATAPARLTTNRRRYDQIVEVVGSRAAGGDLEGVLRGAMVAANYAWNAPIGILNDPALERLVVTLARNGGPAPTVDGTRSGGRVLHVLSQAYDFGGHTRLAWRWMERDGRRSDVALTHQAHAVPGPLRRIAEASGGQVFDLLRTCSSFTARVAALRQLMDGADLVVHHVHPYDSVALAAAALPGPRPPIIYENHADFTYWLGLASTDVLSDHRARSMQLSHELRGIAPRRLGLLPLPLDDAPPSTNRDQVRRSLGLNPTDVVGLSVASPQKMAPVWGRGFDDLLTEVLTAHPRLKVALVGPDCQGVWAGLAARFRGRLLPLGVLGDLDQLYGAADLYLNSYPMPGGTSVLEAALAGMPVVSLRDVDERYGHAAVYQADSPGLAGVGHASTSDHQYVTRLRKLIRDPSLRAREGGLARAAVLAAHTGDGWARSLEALYDQARSVPAADLDEYTQPEPDLGYGGMLISFVSPGTASLEIDAATHVLGEQPDGELLADLFAVANRAEGESLSVRVEAGWEHQPAWTTRLLALARRYPRLAVSLPFIAGDDTGTAGVAQLSQLLARLGQGLDDCGDIGLDAVAPETSGPSLRGELSHLDEALDRLEALVSSPCWTPLASAADASPPALAPVG
jgi:glycosyltransferase involved in cell wall biosynthesis